MAIYGRPLSEITTKDLEELLANNAVENVRLEFKRDIPGKDETLKKLSSFANTFGGLMVIGAEANSKDGKIIDLPGVELQSSFKQTVVQWCFTGAYPPISVEVSDPIAIPAGGDRVCYVLSVAESEIAPHFLNDRKGIYVRTDEFSARFEPRLATENELRGLFDRRKVVQERRASVIARARRRFESFGVRELPQDASAPIKINGGARFDLAIIPRFPVAPVCDRGRLQQVMESHSMAWRGTVFPGYRVDKVSQHESVLALWPGESFSMLEGNIWGLSFYASELPAPGMERQQQQGIHLPGFAGQLLVFLRYSISLLAKCGYAGALLIELRMTGMKGLHWVHFSQGFAQNGPASELDNEIVFSIQAETTDTPDQLATDLLRYIFFATNWPSMAGDDSALKTVLKFAYQYNQWREPDAQR